MTRSEFDQQIRELKNKKGNAIRENEPSTTSNLAEATTTNIIYELRRRGFSGVVNKPKDESLEMEVYDLDKTDWNHENG